MELAEFLSHYRTVPLPSGPAAYADVGEGPVALFVHGLATNGSIWRKVIGAVRAERRCIAVDLPLHGRTPGRPPSASPLSDYADFLEEFCANLGLFEVDLVAFDTGGAVAQVFAVRHGERLASMTLANCDAHTNLPPDAFLPTVEMARRGDLAPAAPVLLDDLDAARAVGFEAGFEDVAVLDDDQVRDFLEPLFATPAAARRFEQVVAALDPGELVALEPDLLGLTDQTPMQWGTGDVFFGIEWAHWLDLTIAGSTGVVEIPGAKLFFAYERPDDLVRVLQAHWNRPAPGPAPVRRSTGLSGVAVGAGRGRG